MPSREQKIRDRLLAKLTPQELFIKDQSHLHAGHEGARDGRGHFDLTIVSSDFTAANRVQRHRMVYDALSDLLETDIHALKIKALTPSER